MPALRKKRQHRPNLKRASSRHVSPRAAAPANARTVLVAIDGSKAAQAAIHLASDMAQAGTWKPEAVTVFEPMPVAVADFALPAAPLATMPEITDGVVGVLRSQLQRSGGGTWDFHIQFGSPAHEIVECAREHGAELIVIGLGKHGKLARLVGAETAVRICRLTSIPVIAVDAGRDKPPHVALVALDFGESSIRAAREALALLQPPGRLHLLHVKWSSLSPQMHDAAWDRLYAAGAEHGFQRLRAELTPPRDIKITTELTQEHVIPAILDTAKEIGADLLAVGSHSQTIVDRMIIGSTTSQLLRAARCSMLIAPPTESVESSNA